MAAKNTRRNLARILFAISFVAAVLALFLSIHQTPHAAVTTPGEQGQVSNKRPPASSVAQYHVPADLPKYVEIPAIGLGKTRILSLGVLANGAIATPPNIFDAGWYKDSAKPGQAGAMFIFGHLSSWQSNGAFHDLKKLKTGDKIIITRGDSKTFTYVVSRSESYAVEDVNMDTVLSPVTLNKPGLNLMTCDGKVIKGTSDFTRREVVYASLND